MKNIRNKTSLQKEKKGNLLHGISKKNSLEEIGIFLSKIKEQELQGAQRCNRNDSESQEMMQFPQRRYSKLKEYKILPLEKTEPTLDKKPE